MSTLRRRIKSGEINCRLQDGKYFISDEPANTHQKNHRPSHKAAVPKMSVRSVESQYNFDSSKEETKSSFSDQLNDLKNSSVKTDDPILSAAGKLLTELKRAYTLILQEKEEQILAFKEEISDLKTLVRVLESENQRLNPGVYVNNNQSDIDC